MHWWMSQRSLCCLLHSCAPSVHRKYSRMTMPLDRKEMMHHCSTSWSSSTPGSRTTLLDFKSIRLDFYSLMLHLFSIGRQGCKQQRRYDKRGLLPMWRTPFVDLHHQLADRYVVNRILKSSHFFCHHSFLQLYIYNK